MRFSFLQRKKPERGTLLSAADVEEAAQPPREGFLAGRDLTVTRRTNPREGHDQHLRIDSLRRESGDNLFFLVGGLSLGLRRGLGGRRGLGLRRGLGGRRGLGLRRGLGQDTGFLLLVEQASKLVHLGEARFLTEPRQRADPAGLLALGVGGEALGLAQSQPTKAGVLGVPGLSLLVRSQESRGPAQALRAGSPRGARGTFQNAPPTLTNIKPPTHGFHEGVKVLLIGTIKISEEGLQELRHNSPRNRRKTLGLKPGNQSVNALLGGLALVEKSFEGRFLRRSHDEHLWSQGDTRVYEK
jgi:hypothetical protein